MTNQPSFHDDGFAALQAWALQARVPPFHARLGAPPATSKCAPGAYRLVTLWHPYLMRPQQCVAAAAETHEACDALASRALAVLRRGEMDWQRAARAPRAPAARLLEPYRVVCASGDEADDETAAACCALAAAKRLGLSVGWAGGRRYRPRLVSVALCDGALCLVHEARGRRLPTPLMALLASDTPKLVLGDVDDTAAASEVSAAAEVSDAAARHLTSEAQALRCCGVHLRGVVGTARAARALGFRDGTEPDVLVGWALGVRLEPGDRAAFGPADIIAPLTDRQRRAAALDAVAAWALAAATDAPRDRQRLYWAPFPEAAAEPEAAAAAATPEAAAAAATPEAAAEPEARPKKETAAAGRRRRLRRQSRAAAAAK